MTQAYLDAAPSGSALRALLGVAFEPAAVPAEVASEGPRAAVWRDDLRFFASAYLLALVFFLLLLV